MQTNDAQATSTHVFVASGHGGDDPGRCVDDLIERDLNAAVAGRLVERLRCHGLSVLTDLDHGNPTFPAEAELAHQLGGVTYYVAVHHNAHHTAARGAEAFGSAGPGHELARSLLDELVAALRSVDPTLPDRGVRPDVGTGATKHLEAAPGHVALVELCFLTSVDDQAIVGDPSYVDLAAEALCRAIVDHGRVDGLWTATHDGRGQALPPAASVVIPTADRPALLRESVSSVLKQTVTGVEVLVVDDGNTPLPVFDDPRVRVLATRGREGPGAARNVGIRAARGRIVTFLDDDDLWTPERLDLALRGLRRAPVAVCATQHIGRPAHPPRRLEGRVGDAVLHSTTPCLGATAVRRADTPEFDVRWQAVEDVVWWLQVARTLDVTTEAEVGYLVRLHDGPRGANTIDQRVAENLTLLREEPVFRTDAAAAAHRWRRVSLLAAEAGDRRTAMRALAHHLWLRPRLTGPRRMLGSAARRIRRVRPRTIRTSVGSAGLPPLDRSGPRTTHLIMSDRARGAEQAARFLADELDEAGTCNRVVALTLSEGNGGRVEIDAAFRSGGDPHLFRLPLLALVFRMRREVRTNPTEVVLAHGAAPALVASLASLLGPFPPFIWHRILAAPTRPWWHVQTLAWRLIVNRAHGVVAITETTVNEVRALGYRGPVWWVPNHRPAGPFAALDPAVEHCRLRDEIGIPIDAPVVGFVGHLVPQKQPHLALEAFAEISELVPDAHLVVAGDGPERPVIEQLARSMGANIHVLGHRDDVPQLLAGIDVLMATSSSDSMPGTVIEAQLAGCPVVGLDADGLADALRPNVSGIIIRDGSMASLARETASLLTDHIRRSAMSDAARSHAAGLTTDQVAPRYAALLDSVAGRDLRRVLHLIPDLGTGGAERALAVLGRHLDPAQFAQLVVTLQGDRRDRSETVAPELDALGVGRGDLGLTGRPTRHPLNAIVGARRLRRIARRWDADIIDAALLDASLVSRLTPAAVARVSHLVNTPWDAIVGRTAGGSRWRRRALRQIDRWSARRDHALVAISDAVARSARHDLGRSIDTRLRTIPRGVDLQRFAPLPAPAPAPTLRLVSIGRLVPQKGHDTLIEAISLLLARGVDVSLTIVGEGTERASLLGLVRRLGIEANVELAGSHQDVRPFLAAADAFVLASRWEGQSNAVLEAMASARTVVVGDVPALREVVGDAGIVVPPNDAVAWADALASLAADPAGHARQGCAARHRAEAIHGAHARSAELGDLYTELVGPKMSSGMPPG